jgi:hypothetical protein
MGLGAITVRLLARQHHDPHAADGVPGLDRADADPEASCRGGLQASSPDVVRAHFAIEDDGSFDLEAATMVVLPS